MALKRIREGARWWKGPDFFGLTMWRSDGGDRVSESSRVEVDREEGGKTGGKSE
jgi:hypothetical protein